MRRDDDLRRDLEDELRWSPQIDETDISVKVNDGVVSLTGFVSSYFEKYHAELLMKRVRGVAGIANDLSVRLPPTDKLDDPQIARAAVADRIRVLVHQGHITIEGTVDWSHQRDRAEATLRHLRGVMGVSNELIITPAARPADIKGLIEAAFKRSAQVDADGINVQAEGGKVLLDGPRAHVVRANGSGAEHCVGNAGCSRGAE